MRLLSAASTQGEGAPDGKVTDDPKKSIRDLEVLV